MSSKRQPKRRYTDHDRFVGLPHYMLKCAAWMALSPNGKAILIEVWKRFDGANNGQIGFSVREGEAIGLGKNPAGSAFRELLELGFLKVGRNSLFTLKTKEARTWFITALPNPDGSSGSKDFMRWASTGTRPEPRSSREDCGAIKSDAVGKTPTGAKNRTRSPTEDRRSSTEDRKAFDETKLPETVLCRGPSTIISTDSQSSMGDTYTYHMLSAEIGSAGASSSSAATAVANPVALRVIPGGKLIGSGDTSIVERSAAPADCGLSPSEDTPKANSIAAASVDPDLDALFAEFWGIWPEKPAMKVEKRRSRARKAFRDACPAIDPRVMIQLANTFVSDPVSAQFYGPALDDPAKWIFAEVTGFPLSRTPSPAVPTDRQTRAPRNTTATREKFARDLREALGAVGWSAAYFRTVVPAPWDEPDALESILEARTSVTPKERSRLLQVPLAEIARQKRARGRPYSPRQR